MIVDDHSSDNSLNIVKQYAAKIPELKFKTPTGIISALQTGYNILKES